MAHKATSPETAKRVLEAQGLARGGASSALIGRLTGFGPRYIRALVKNQGGVLSRKPRHPRHWMRERSRLAHVQYIVLFYESQYAHASAAGRILRVYALYETWIGEQKLLDLDQCAQVIDLYERLGLHECHCKKCPHTFLAPTDELICPKCRLGHRSVTVGQDPVLRSPEDTEYTHASG